MKRFLKEALIQYVTSPFMQIIAIVEFKRLRYENRVFQTGLFRDNDLDLYLGGA
jgi:hypothetical protein